MTTYIDLSEAGDILGLSIDATYALVRRGELRAIKLAGKGGWVLDRAVVQEYANNHWQDLRG